MIKRIEIQGKRTTVEELLEQDRRDVTVNINHQRELRGWSVADLAEACEIPQRSLRNLLKADGPPPFFYQICKVAYAFGVPVNVLTCPHTERLNEGLRMLRFWDSCTDFEMEILRMVVQGLITSRTHARKDLRISEDDLGKFVSNGN